MQPGNRSWTHDDPAPGLGVAPALRSAALDPVEMQLSIGTALAGVVLPAVLPSEAELADGLARARSSLGQAPAPAAERRSA